MRHAHFATFVCLVISVASVTAGAQTVTQLCTPKITANVVVASPSQRYAAGQKAEPPIDDETSGFAWPDTPRGVIKTASGYEFFRQRWRRPFPSDVGRTLGGEQQVGIVCHDRRHARQPARLWGSSRRQRLPESRSVREPELSELRLHGRRPSFSGPGGHARRGQVARDLSRRAA